MYIYTNNYIYTSVLLCIDMHRECGTKSEVDPIVELIWSKVWITKTITISIAKAIAFLPHTIQKWETVQERDMITLSKGGKRTKWETIETMGRQQWRQWSTTRARTTENWKSSVKTGGREQWRRWSTTMATRWTTNEFEGKHVTLSKGGNDQHHRACAQT